MYANASKHNRTMGPLLDSRGRRKGKRAMPCWRCLKMGVTGNRCTSVGYANGCGMMAGCEWHVRRWVKGLDR
jgi:hypothetical protein